MIKDRLEDIIDDRTAILFCGMAAGEMSCKMNHYYANSSNRFWQILFEVGAIKSIIKPSEDKRIREANYNELRRAGIGLTDLVKDQCGMDKGIVVKDKDIERLKNLIKNRKQLKVLIFNGKKPASKFLKIRPKDLEFGNQKEKSKYFGINICIMPSTSGVNTRFTIKDIAKLLKFYIKY
jgi:TDG/mug DNA glycosylase family protein